eukprot:1196257-Prorocentrum_minimum.AAC.1
MRAAGAGGRGFVLLLGGVNLEQVLQMRLPGHPNTCVRHGLLMIGGSPCRPPVDPLWTPCGPPRNKHVDRIGSRCECGRGKISRGRFNKQAQNTKRGVWRASDRAARPQRTAGSAPSRP